MTRLATSQANRGQALEDLINAANDQYRQREMAAIQKRPTPIKILKSQGSRIVSAVIESKSTVDYEGTYRGHSLQFEAKQTTERTSFPLANLHAHQVEHLRLCDFCGGITFVLLEWTKRHEIYYVPGPYVVRMWDAANSGSRKSIPYDDVATMCYKVEQGRGVVLDYLAVVDELLKQTTAV